MPELPEMENYRKLLSQHIINVPISDVIVNREKSINMETEAFRNALIGARVVFVERRAKYILFHLHDGRRLLLHLMLGGILFMARRKNGRIVTHKSKSHLEIISFTLLDFA